MLKARERLQFVKNLKSPEIDGFVKDKSKYIRREVAVRGSLSIIEPLLKDKDEHTAMYAGYRLNDPELKSRFLVYGWYWIDISLRNDLRPKVVNYNSPRVKVPTNYLVKIALEDSVSNSLEAIQRIKRQHDINAFKEVTDNLIQRKKQPKRLLDEMAVAPTLEEYNYLLQKGFDPAECCLSGKTKDPSVAKILATNILAKSGTNKIKEKYSTTFYVLLDRPQSQEIQEIVANSNNLEAIMYLINEHTSKDLLLKLAKRKDLPARIRADIAINSNKEIWKYLKKDSLLFEGIGMTPSFMIPNHVKADWDKYYDKKQKQISGSLDF